jgi:hypothetical protein
LLLHLVQASSFTSRSASTKLNPGKGKYVFYNQPLGVKYAGVRSGC